MIVDFHCHSNRSYDGFTSPRELVHACTVRGIDVLAITDHDCISQSVINYLKSHGIDVIPGCEFTDHTGSHIIGLFVEDSLPCGSTDEQILNHIQNQGGLCLMPHPWKPGSGFMAMNGSSELLSRFHFIELINGGWPARRYSRQIIELANSYGLRMIASSDAHKACQVGLCCTRFRDNGNSSNLFEILSQSNQDDIDLMIDSNLLQRLGRRTSSIQKTIIYQTLLPFIPPFFRRLTKLALYRFSSQRFSRKGELSIIDPNFSPW